MSSTMFAANLLRLGKGFYRPIHSTSLAKAKFKDGGQHATFNDVPIPQGCWKESNARRQKRYMTVLLSGLGSFVGSLIFVAQSGLIFLNYTVPDYPYEDKE